jgi:hypothetical protein
VFKWLFKNWSRKFVIRSLTN